MNRQLTTLLTCIALTAAAYAADAPAAPAGSKTASSSANDDASAQLLKKHLTAFVQNDLDAVVSDYTSDAVFIAPEATYVGPEQIRVFFRNLMQHFPKGPSTLDLDRTVYNGDMIYFIWHGKTPTLDVPFATDTMVLRGGKIVKQTFAGVLQPTTH